MATETRIKLHATGKLIEVFQEVRPKKMQDAFSIIFSECRNRRDFVERCAEIREVMTDFIERVEAEEAAFEDDSSDGPEFRSFMAAALKAFKTQLANDSLSAPERADIEAMVARCEDYFSWMASLN